MKRVSVLGRDGNKYCILDDRTCKHLHFVEISSVESVPQKNLPFSAFLLQLLGIEVIKFQRWLSNWTSGPTGMLLADTLVFLFFSRNCGNHSRLTLMVSRYFPSWVHAPSYQSVNLAHCELTLSSL